MTIEWHQLAFYALAYWVTVVTAWPFVAAIAARPEGLRLFCRRLDGRHRRYLDG